MDNVLISVKYKGSKSFCDLEIPLSLSVYELIEIVTFKFDWIKTAPKNTTQKVIIDIPGKEIETAEEFEVFSSKPIVDGTYITILPSYNHGDIFDKNGYEEDLDVVWVKP